MFLSLMANAQNTSVVKLEDVKLIKNSKVIFVLTNDESTNEVIKKIGRDFWSFTPVEGYMTGKEANEKAENGTGYVFIKLEGASQNTIRIYDKDDNLLIENRLPAVSNETIGMDEAYAFGITSIQYFMNTMLLKNFKNNIWWKQFYGLHCLEMKSKKLYILQSIGSDKLNAENLKGLYHYQAEIVNHERWKDAILNKREGIIYVLIVSRTTSHYEMNGSNPSTSSTSQVYYHYLVDSETGIVYDVLKGAKKIKKSSIKEYNKAAECR